MNFFIKVIDGTAERRVLVGRLGIFKDVLFFFVTVIIYISCSEVVIQHRPVLVLQGEMGESGGGAPCPDSLWMSCK